MQAIIPAALLLRPVKTLLQKLALTALFYVVIASATSVGAEGFHFENIRSLSEPKLKALITAVLHERLEFLKNIEFQSTTTIRNHKLLNDGKIGEVVWPGMRIDHTFYRMGDSYRLVTDQFHDAKSAVPVQHVQSGFNSDTGRSRGRINRHDSDRFHCRVDTTHDAVLSDCRYLYWLEGPGWPDHDYILPLLLRNVDTATLSKDSERELVELSYAGDDPEMDGHRIGGKFLLDPSRNFAVKQYSVFSSLRGGATRHIEAEVLESKKVKQWWLPVSVREIVHSDEILVGVANVWLTSVQSISCGTVEEDDLVVEFPEGARVIDAIDSNSYSVGANNSKTQIRSLEETALLTEE